MKELPAAEDLYALVSIDLLNDGGNYPVYHLTEKNGVVHEIDPKHPGIFSIDVRVGAGDPKVRLKSLTSTEPVKLINSTAADLTRGVTWTPGKPFAKRDIPATDARMGGDSVV